MGQEYGPVSGVLGFVAIGLLLIGLLAALLRRTEPAKDDPLPSSLGSLQFGDRKKDILDRVFGREDWDFVLSHAPKDVRRLFLIERKRIALSWLSEIRSQSKAAMRFHVARARMSEHLSPMQELVLAVNYLVIRVKCAFIVAVVLLRGPVALRSMAGCASHLSGQFQGWIEAALQATAFAAKSRVSE